MVNRSESGVHPPAVVQAPRRVSTRAAGPDRRHTLSEIATTRIPNKIKDVLRVAEPPASGDAREQPIGPEQIVPKAKGDTCLPLNSNSKYQRFLATQLAIVSKWQVCAFPLGIATRSCLAQIDGCKASAFDS